MTNEQVLTNFMRQHYSDERLAMLLAHAEDGNLAFWSCCCFIGVATADHALRPAAYKTGIHPGAEPHYRKAKELPGATEAERAFLEIGGSSGLSKLIPIIKAEIERRDHERSSSLSKSQVTVGV